MRRPEHCADCRRPMRTACDPTPGRVRHCARGLCDRCHKAHAARGDLADFERLSMPAAVTCDEVELLATDGHSRRQIATRLGVSTQAITDAFTRQHRVLPVPLRRTV